MNDSQWDAKLKSFLKKTGDDFKRFGADVKVEAQKLLVEVKDPHRQQKLREGLKDVSVWAKKAAEDVASLVETGVKRAEDAISKASDKMNDFVVKPTVPSAQRNAAAAAPTPPSPPPDMDDVAPPPARKAAKAKKTIGKGTGSKKKKGTGAQSSSPKTMGKKSPPEEG